jgi:hypothetical protein
MNTLRYRVLRLVLMAGCLISPSAMAADPLPEPEPLWQQAIREIKRGQTLVASKVVTQITVRDGDDVFLGSIESVDVVSGTKRGRPVWVNVSKKTTGSPGFTMELNLHIEDDPGGVLDGYDIWTPQGLTHFGGEPAILWAGVSAKDAASRALVTVDPETGRPGQAELHLPIRSNLGTRTISVTVNFGPGPDGTWVPLGAVIDQAGRFMFWKRHVIITKSFQDWVERPAL